MTNYAITEREQRDEAVDGAKETDLWRCTVCGRFGAVGRCCGEETRERASMEQLMAEYERLRAEAERLKSMTAVTMGIGSGDGNLFVHGDYDSIKVAQSRLFRAKRMEKALEDTRSLSSINSAMNPSPLAPAARLGDIHRIADAVLSKEKDNEQ